MGEDEKKFELRELKSIDMFPMVQILKKIGISEFKDITKKDSIMALAKSGGDASLVGIAVVSEIATVVIEHVNDAKNDIYSFLGSLSGMKRKELEDLDFVSFAEMIVEVIQKDEFKGFITVVSKLLK